MISSEIWVKHLYSGPTIGSGCKGHHRGTIAAPGKYRDKKSIEKLRFFV